jgi:hypothetical protein
MTQRIPLPLANVVPMIRFGREQAQHARHAIFVPRRHESRNVLRRRVRQEYIPFLQKGRESFELEGLI